MCQNLPFSWRCRSIGDASPQRRFVSRKISKMNHARTSTSEDEEQLDFEQAMRDFRCMFPSVPPAGIESVLRRNRGRVDDTIDDLLAMQSDPVAHNQKHLELDDDPPPYTARECDSPCFSASTKKRYNALILLPLPDDFLRLDTSEGSAQSGHPEKVPPSQREFGSRHDKPRPHQHVQQPHFAQLGVFRMGSPGSSYWQHGQNYPRRAHKGLEAPGTSSSGFSARRRKRYEETRKQAVALKDLMAENHFQRQVANDPELERYLEDERVAILLQNEEFMHELRRDKGFMKSLEQGLQLGPEAYTCLDLDSNAPLCSRANSGDNSGYDYGSDELPDAAATAFPHTKTLHGQGEPVEFGEKVKVMSKVTRQKFALAARKFSKRARGGASSAYPPDSAHWREALIEDDYGDEGRNPAQTGATYDQPSVDDEYNIGNRRNLKEGRLFSR